MQLSEALLYILGFDHCDAGRQLGIAWDLPDFLINALDYRLDEDTIEEADDIVVLIDVTVSMLRALQLSRPWAIPQAPLERLGITQADASGVFEHLSHQLPEVEELANMLFS